MSVLERLNACVEAGPEGSLPVVGQAGVEKRTGVVEVSHAVDPRCHGEPFRNHCGKRCYATVWKVLRACACHAPHHPAGRREAEFAAHEGVFTPQQRQVHVFAGLFRG